MSRKHEVDIPAARADLEWLRARYDGGAVSIGVYVTIRRLETDIAWSEHENWQRLGDVVSAIVKKLGEPDS
jgi:hypothetical protein